MAASAEELFDLVVAAETLQYLGPLEGVFGDTSRVLRVGGYLAFTVDRLIGGVEEDDDPRETAEGESERGASRQCQVRSDCPSDSGKLLHELLVHVGHLSVGLDQGFPPDRYLESHNPVPCKFPGYKRILVDMLFSSLLSCFRPQKLQLSSRSRRTALMLTTEPIWKHWR